MNAETIYRKLPVWLQHCACSCAGWRIQSQRFNAHFQQCLADYESRAFWSPDRLAGLRSRRLIETCSMAALHIPHYRQVLAGLDFKVGSSGDTSWLCQVPILRKETVQTERARFTRSLSNLGQVMEMHTSGSTGAAMRFPLTRSGNREQWAVWWRYRRWHGIPLDAHCLYFAGRLVVPREQRKPPFWRYNLPGRQVLFSGYHLSPSTARAYLEEAARHPGAWLHGYPSMLALLAAHATELGIQCRFKWVTTAAESLLPHQADLILRAFGVKPRQHYGMAEGVANFSECPEGNVHVDEDFAFVEFLPLGDSHYSIVGTSFFNPAFPLIRYEVGDVATITGRTCSCGRPGRVVDSIDGRIEDYIVTKSGFRIGRLDHVFKHMINVQAAQIEQTRPGVALVKIVRGTSYSLKDEAQLRSELELRVGHDLDFDIVEVSELQRTANGKLRFVVSTLNEARIDSAGGSGPNAT